MQGICKKQVDKRLSHPKLDRNIESLPGEEWKDLERWDGKLLHEGYQVSNLGRVRNLGRVMWQLGRNGQMVRHPYPACMLRLSPDPDGYLHVSLCGPELQHPITPAVHRLVATMFLPTQPRPDQTHVNHIDGNKENNCPSNLEWASPDENNRHARQTGLARLGTSQAIHARVVEWDCIFESKSKLDAALGWASGYVNYHQAHGLPILDRQTGHEVHIEYITKEVNV